MANALGQVLGLKVDGRAGQLRRHHPGLTAGRYDIGMSSFTDNKAREETFDFVTYF